MNRQTSPPPPTRYWPLGQLILARLREFYREPEAIFWVYGFPILIIVALGIAFRNKPVERITVDVQESPGQQSRVESIRKKLSEDKKQEYVVSIEDEETCRHDLAALPKVMGRQKCRRND